MEFKTLYSKGKKNEIRSWTIRTENEVIITEHGQLGGKLQTSRKTAKGKNAGKANETSPSQQAILQAQSMHKKQIDKGYFDSIEKAENTEVFLPMLADKFDKKKHKLQYPCIVQPKMDGVRSLAYWEDGKVKLMSRGGKPYDVQHIASECAGFLAQDQVFDGELYSHGTALQDINSWVKKPKPESLRLEYWIYDTFFRDDLDLPFKERLAALKRLYASPGFEVGSLCAVPHSTMNDEAGARIHEVEFVKRGFEGAIVRDLRGKYELRKRSTYLLKVKSFQDDEFPIVGFNEGVGKFEGCVIWTCETPEGRTFNVIPKGTMQQKAEWFQNGESYLGQLLKVKFFAYTKDNIPQFPVGLAIRLEEDM